MVNTTIISRIFILLAVWVTFVSCSGGGGGYSESATGISLQLYPLADLPWWASAHGTAEQQQSVTLLNLNRFGFDMEANKSTFFVIRTGHSFSRLSP